MGRKTPRELSFPVLNATGWKRFCFLKPYKPTKLFWASAEGFSSSMFFSQHPSEIVHRQGKPYDIPTHQVNLSGDLKALLGKEILNVNTLHHQAVKDIGSSLVPMAIAPDGIIEAVRMVGKRFVWAVQWYPEYMFRTDSDSLAILSCFVEHCISFKKS